jgi:hypothetical protein
MKMNFERGRWSFTADDGAGWRKLGFELNGISCSDYLISDNANGLDAIGYGSGWKEELQFRYGTAVDSLLVRRIITNTGTGPLILESISDGKLEDTGEVFLPEANEYTVRYVHSSNMRTEKFPRSRPEYPYVRQVPYEPLRFGHDEANHFPALIVCDENYKCMLVEGELNQTAFVREWELGLNGGVSKQLLGTYRARQVYPMSGAKVLAAGEAAEVSHVFYQILRNSHPQYAFSGYLEALNREHDFAGKRSSMLHGALYCTWNFGTYEAIDAENVIARAKKLAGEVPECTHFLIDDGYQAERKGRNAGIDSFYPDPAKGFDCEKFQDGMKIVADAISDAGLVPCIWLAPKVYLDSRLAMEHPEWLMRDVNGSEKILGNTTFLDLSVVPARDFFLQVLDVLFKEWGFKGLKFDFMTQWFSLGNARYGNGGSGPEWRDFLFREIRKRIGSDGLFMTCIAMSMGNPFPGLYADCYRCGCDIHMGTWPEQIKAVKSTLPQILVPGRQTFLLNMDSAGFGPVPENEQIFRLTWVFITQGILEIGGKVEELTSEQIGLFRKLLKNADRGNKVVCLDERAFTGDGFPEALMVAYPENSPWSRDGVGKHIAFFNWSDSAKTVSVSAEKSGISDRNRISDYWTGEACHLQQELLVAALPPHACKLFEIS